jgi:hypothetical protein
VRSPWGEQRNSVAYSAYFWPLGVTLGLALFEVIACVPTGVYEDPGYNGQGGDAAGPGGTGGDSAGTGASSGAGQGGAGAGGPGGGSGAGGPGGAGAQGGVGPGGAGGVGPGGVGGDNSGGMGALPPFDAGTDPARNRVPAGQVCDRLATVQCAAEIACCGNPGRSFDQCKQIQRDGCTSEAHLDEVSLNPVANYSIDRAEAAFSQFEQMAARCDTSVAQWATTSQGLRGIVQGTVDRGGSCKPPTGQTTNPPVAAAYLASCRDGDNTACRPINLTQWTCEGRGQVGAPCFTDLNCVEGVYCDNPELRPVGATCKPRKPDQSGCAAANECMSLLCKGGVCVPPSVGAVYCLAQ